VISRSAMLICTIDRVSSEEPATSLSASGARG
jgi:hypothetical protein